MFWVLALVGRLSSFVEERWAKGRVTAVRDVVSCPKAHVSGAKAIRHHTDGLLAAAICLCLSLCPIPHICNEQPDLLLFGEGGVDLRQRSKVYTCGWSQVLSLWLVVLKICISAEPSCSVSLGVRFWRRVTRLCR